MADPHEGLIAHALGERVKELSALHSAATLLQDEALELLLLFERLVALLPPAFQFPEVTAASVEYGDARAVTPGFAPQRECLTSRFTTSDERHGRIDVIYLDDRPPAAEGPFLIEERRLLDSLARMVENALNRRIAEAAARRAEADLRAALAATEAERDRSRALLTIAAGINTHLELKDLLSTISQLLTRAIPHHFASITLWEAEAQSLRRYALVFPRGRGLLQDDVLLRTDRPTPARTAFDRNQTVIFRRAEIAALGEHSRSVMEAEGLITACCIPLRSPRGTIGTLNFASPREDAFDATEVTFLEQMAAQLAGAVDNAFAYREISDLRDQLNEKRQYLEDEVTNHYQFRDIVGKSRALSEVLEQIRTVAPTDATVLLLGETGTGKELLARAVHEASRRCGETFVRVNGAALPASLVESELFGYERGAFTGAAAGKAGRFELANRGTLFLDEIGEVAIDVQPKLLRALQEQEFERLGGTRTVHVDVRVIAATNRDLETMVHAGEFRSDLFYRLSVFPITIPPLRERKEDIAPLVRQFAHRFARELGREIFVPTSALAALEAWNWPGNIRELQNVVERAVILARDGEVRIPPGLLGVRAAPRARRPEPELLEAPRSFEDHERTAILTALRQAQGVLAGPNGAAARLGLKRTTLQSKMRKLGITRPSY